MFRARIRQRTQEHFPVIPRDDATVEKHDGAVVGLGADEATEALTEAKSSLRQLKLHERVVVALGSPLDQRIIGHAEGQPDDHDAAEDVARQVHALPEGLRAEEHRAALRETLKERTTRAVNALREDRETLAFERAQARRRVSKARVRGEQDERTTVERPRDILDKPRRFFDETFLGGKRDVRREHEERLTLVVERRPDGERFRDVGYAEPIESEVE